MKPLDMAIKVDGKLHYGTYSIDGTTVSVAYRGKSKATQAKGSRAEMIAAMPLRELVWESRHRS